MLVRLPPSVTWDDLVSAGFIGLIEAVDRFDPERSREFVSFARVRIRGAMLDSLRELDLLPRSMRERANELQRVTTRLTAELGRPPEDHELAAALDVDIERVRSIRQHVHSARVVGFEDLAEPGAERQSSPQDDLVDKHELSHDEAIELGEARDLFRNAFDGLPERLRVLLTLYYIEDLTMQEIAVVMQVTVGRISQLHSSAIQRLRDALEENDLQVDRRRLALLFRSGEES